MNLKMSKRQEKVYTHLSEISKEHAPA